MKFGWTRFWPIVTSRDLICRPKGGTGKHEKFRISCFVNFDWKNLNLGEGLLEVMWGQNYVMLKFQAKATKKFELIFKLIFILSLAKKIK